MTSGNTKLVENVDSVCVGGSHGGFPRPNLMLNEDDLQISVSFVRNWIVPTFLREGRG